MDEKDWEVVVYVLALISNYIRLDNSIGVNNIKQRKYDFITFQTITNS